MSTPSLCSSSGVSTNVPKKSGGGGGVNSVPLRCLGDPDCVTVLDWSSAGDSLVNANSAYLSQKRNAVKIEVANMREDKTSRVNTTGERRTGTKLWHYPV